MKRRGSTQGFTLVEILIAIVIGLFLTAGMVQMYVASKQSYRFNEALARMQENGRYALERMARDLRMADFWGCAGTDAITENLTAQTFDPANNAQAGLFGTDNVSPATDTITLSGALATGLTLFGTMADATAVVIVDALVDSGCVGGICDDDVVLIADCGSGDIFRVTGVATVATEASLAHATGTGTTPRNSTDSLSKVYDVAASVYALRTASYSVADSGGQPSLRIDRNDGAGPQPIAEGVADMQIQYGIDVNNDKSANRYVPASVVVSAGSPATDWSDVVSVRLSLLLRSTEGGLTESAQSILYNGGTFTATDSNLYQVMTTTVNIRNRVQ